MKKIDNLLAEFCSTVVICVYISENFVNCTSSPVMIIHICIVLLFTVFQQPVELIQRSAADLANDFNVPAESAETIYANYEQERLSKFTYK